MGNIESFHSKLIRKIKKAWKDITLTLRIHTYVFNNITYLVPISKMLKKVYILYTFGLKLKLRNLMVYTNKHLEGIELDKSLNSQKSCAV